MKNRKSLIVCAIGGLILLAVASGVLHTQPDDDGNRYEELLRVRRAEARFIHWRTNAAYRFVSRAARFDLATHYGQSANKLETLLVKSGGLVWLRFYAPSRPDQLIGQPYLNSSGRLDFMRRDQNPLGNNQYVKCSFSEDAIRLLCRPKDVAFWESAFTCITNRVRWGKLSAFAGNNEEASCSLPDGSIVPLVTCRNWMDESINSGWMVGIYSQTDQRGQSRLIASRRKPRDEVK